MNLIYKELLESVESGNRVAVISGYSESGIYKELADQTDSRYQSNCGGADEGLVFSYVDGGITIHEYYESVPRLIILGGGHIALPLSKLGASLGFRVVVFDDRPSFANTVRFPDAETVICDTFDNLTKHIKIVKNDYVVIVTRGHRHDSQCLRELLCCDFPRYMGMIGSRSRVDIVKRQLGEETGETDKLAQLHAPIGLPIGAVTPDEIALSILAEITRTRRLGTESRPLSESRQYLVPDMELLRWLTEYQQTEAALVTVVSTVGSTPREIGAKMVVLPHGQTIGSIGGGCAEAAVMLKSVSILERGGFCLMDIDMSDSAETDGMVCGGTMKVMIEKLQINSICS